MVYTEFAKQDTLNKLRNKKGSADAMLWDNLCVKASKKKFYKSVPESSLSILTNDAGVSHCKIDGKYFKLCHATFIVLNPFQELEYSIESTQNKVKTHNIHFNYKFALEGFRTLENVLDQPNSDEMSMPDFFNELHYKDLSISLMLNSLFSQNSDDMDLYFSNIIQYLSTVCLNTKHKIQSYDSIKKSTKVELFKRVSRAKDIIFSEYDSDLSIEGLSQSAYLSKYHFIRIFKKTYGITPYEMLKSIRLEKAREYLKLTDYPLDEIANLVGFLEANSLSNAFKHKYGMPPGKYRISNNE